MLRRVAAVLALAALLASPAAGFDTYWHSQCTQKAGEQLGFAEDAWKIMQLGNSAHFGPRLAVRFPRPELQRTRCPESNPRPIIRASAAPPSSCTSRSERRLPAQLRFRLPVQPPARHHPEATGQLQQRQPRRAHPQGPHSITLGASLHAVQDFYSHSDWVHADFNQTDVKMVKLDGGGWRAPTWYEFRGKHKNPDKWRFRVAAGIYPPVANAPNTHIQM